MLVKEKIQISLTSEEIENLEMDLERAIDYYSDMVYDADYYNAEDTVERYNRRIQSTRKLLIKIRKQHLADTIEKRIQQIG